MKKTISEWDFQDAFNKSDSYKNNFSYEGKIALFEWLERYEEETETEIELDIIALCCEYTEYESFEELQKDYSNIETMEELENKTIVIPIEETERFIIQQF